MSRHRVSSWVALPAAPGPDGAARFGYCGYFAGVADAARRARADIEVYTGRRGPVTYTLRHRPYGDLVEVTTIITTGETT